MKTNNRTIVNTGIALSLLAASVLQASHAAEIKEVSFTSEGKTIVGHLYLPDGHKAKSNVPAVVVTGAWTTVKEQMSADYAAALADKGYAALTFDFRGWGGSQGDIKYLESPAEKIADINAAVEFLTTLDGVDGNRISGLGICASAGYISDVAATNDDMKSFALVAPWLHNQEILNAVYGGETSVQNLIQMGIDAGDTTYIEAASATNVDSLMFQAPYYTEPTRGLIEEYDNKFNVASWGPWLNYDAIQTAEVQTKPGLLIHSDAAAIPQGAKQYAYIAGGTINLVMLDDISQFDFYDTPSVITTSVTLIDEHFSAAF